MVDNVVVLAVFNVVAVVLEVVVVILLALTVVSSRVVDFVVVLGDGLDLLEMI